MLRQRLHIPTIQSGRPPNPATQYARNCGKSGDYSRDAILGHPIVEEHGGRVVARAFWPGVSTSAFMNRIHSLSPPE